MLNLPKLMPVLLMCLILSPRMPVFAQRASVDSGLLGSTVPDLVGLDESGHEINLRELKGDYKVLVFGCLT